jgi:hypothetical protein
MKKKFVLLLLITLLLTPCLMAQENQEKTISGTVVDLDWVSSTITIRYYPAFSIDADEINLKITDDSQLHQATGSISFSDILQSDPVSVTYYDDGISGLKVKHLTDLNLAAI